MSHVAPPPPRRLQAILLPYCTDQSYPADTQFLYQMYPADTLSSSWRATSAFAEPTCSGARCPHVGHEYFKDSLRRASAEASAAEDKCEAAAAKLKCEPAAAPEGASASSGAKQELAVPEVMHLEDAMLEGARIFFSAWWRQERHPRAATHRRLRRLRE